MEEPAEETVAGRSELGDAGEERAHEMSATDGEDSRVPAAPDVTYDATLLEQHQSETTAKEKAVRFKEEVTGLEEDPPIARGEEDKKEKEEEEKDEWMDILGTGDLKKKVVRDGGGVETRPTPLSRVRIRTKGQLDNGAVVDRHSSIPFTLGDGDVLQAWDLSVSLMEVGELALVRTSPRFAYGRQGRTPDIPANASITYELELLDVQPPVDYATVTEQELTTLVDRKRIRGNELFQRKDYELAVNSYDKALKLIDSYTGEHESEELPPAISDMHVRCLNNLAAAYLKVERYKESQETCQKVLEKEPENVKALFRYGKVLAIRGDLSEAVKHLQKALELNPDERAIQVELQKAQKKKDRVEKEEREMYRRMVSNPPKSTGRAENPRHSLWKRLIQGPVPYLAVAAVVGIAGIAIAYYWTQT
ncbi:Peptidyl-prolyl cis-trans isomerase FKBP8 [Geodia barretti]|uniref:peptidylprolyl isomerase n=1 Tax=Geodia barretti TaxID=519541 RepID=A0AA35VWT7_GEOBA|nr:Peptidyl-prolyl cis-trans isomerase FKBP8 [Geodia barretti]